MRLATASMPETKRLNANRVTASFLRVNRASNSLSFMSVTGSPSTLDFVLRSPKGLRGVAGLCKPSDAKAIFNHFRLECPSINPRITQNRGDETCRHLAVKSLVLLRRRLEGTRPAFECPSLSFVAFEESQIRHHVVSNKMLLARMEPG
jgi:hypothetical protein